MIFQHAPESSGGSEELFRDHRSLKAKMGGAAEQESWYFPPDSIRTSLQTCFTSLCFQFIVLLNK